MNLSDQSLIHHPSYDNMIIQQYRKEINKTDKFRFIEEFRKEYIPAEILAQLRRNMSEFKWHIHSYVERSYSYGEERITLVLVRVKQIYDDGTFTTHTVLPSFLLPYHVIGAQEIMAIINDDEKEAPENDEADAHVSSSFACYIRRTMCTLAHKSYLAICQALNRGRKIFMETT